MGLTANLRKQAKKSAQAHDQVINRPRGEKGRAGKILGFGQVWPIKITLDNHGGDCSDEDEWQCKRSEVDNAKMARINEPVRNFPGASFQMQRSQADAHDRKRLSWTPPDAFSLPCHGVFKNYGLWRKTIMKKGRFDMRKGKRGLL
nr:hypothetical protein Iba_chr14dCG18500 [Ipomoea batatas]